MLGLAYKPDVDDVRESPSFELIEKLTSLGAKVDFHDPHVTATHKMRHHDLHMKSINLTPSDVPGPNPVTGVTQASVNTVTQILQNQYNYAAGSFGASVPISNQDYFARIDANITDKQHLFVTYQRTDGATLNAPNGSTSGTLGLSSDYYVLDQLLETYTADLVSHWTDKLSTEIEYTHQNIATPSVLEGAPFAMFKMIEPAFLSPS